MKEAEVRAGVAAALVAFHQEDAYLLTHDLSERCITSRIAYHLQCVFREFEVDVEYNRDGYTTRRLNLPEECGDNGRPCVTPDIVVHKRGPDGPNLLCIELKKKEDRRGQRGLDCDRQRIRALLEECGFEFGALLECETGDNPKLTVRDWLP